MNEKTCKISVKCPNCKRPRSIIFNKESLKNIKSGVISVTLEKGEECQHEILVYIDKYFKIRDCLVIDYKFELPELELTNDCIPNIDFEELNSYYVKKNFLPIEIVYILRGIFLGKKILLVNNNNEFINNYFLSFLNFVCYNCFEFKIKIENKKVYQKNKKLYRQYLIIDKDRIINDKGKRIFLKKIAVEKKIVHKFFSEDDNFLCNIMIQNEITKAFFLSDLIKNYLEKEDKNSKVSIPEINDEIQKICDIRIDNNYMYFLFEILENYYGFKLPKIVNNFLDFIL